MFSDYIKCLSIQDSAPALLGQLQRYSRSLAAIPGHFGSHFCSGIKPLVSSSSCLVRWWMGDYRPV